MKNEEFNRKLGARIRKELEIDGDAYLNTLNGVRVAIYDARTYTFGSPDRGLRVDVRGAGSCRGVTYKIDPKPTDTPESVDIAATVAKVRARVALVADAAKAEKARVAEEDRKRLEMRERQVNLKRAFKACGFTVGVEGDCDAVVFDDPQDILTHLEKFPRQKGGANG